jgi:hypothetical protein
MPALNEEFFDLALSKRDASVPLALAVGIPLFCHGVGGCFLLVVLSLGIPLSSLGLLTTHYSNKLSHAELNKPKQTKEINENIRIMPPLKAQVLTTLQICSVERERGT